jgi:hypothetical protein
MREIKCWSCDGSGIASYANMNTACIDIECRRCNATGKCPEIMREWAKLGEKYRQQRRADRKTARIRAKEIGCTPSDLSKAEAGLIDPREIYKEGEE